MDGEFLKELGLQGSCGEHIEMVLHACTYFSRCILEKRYKI